jgi:predicted nucleic acid-binding protein
MHFDSIPAVGLRRIKRAVSACQKRFPGVFAGRFGHADTHRHRSPRAHVKLVLDTSAVIHLVERKPTALVNELRKSTEAPFISVVSLGELAVGWATLSADSLQRRTYYAARRLRVVPIAVDGLATEPTDLITSFGVCRLAGIKGNDAWIAATAHYIAATLITYDATLATRFATVGLSKLLAL